MGLQNWYAKQEVPNGLAQAFVIGEKFIGNDSVALVLGIIFFTVLVSANCCRASANPEGTGNIYLPCKRPGRYGVVEFDAAFNALSIEEKPEQPKSNYAVPDYTFMTTK